MLSIFHRKRTNAEVKAGAAAGGTLLWVRKKLPDAGAEQYAFETYGTPVYDFALGNGATFVRRPLVETQPALFQNYTAPILANPPLNTYQGQFATQPLINPNDAIAAGITVEGAIPPDSYNLISSAAPSLNP